MQLSPLIEQAVATVGNVDTVISRSEDGLSSVQVTFLFGTDSVQAANQVQSSISQILGQLPSEAERPVVSRLSLDNVPVLYLSLSGAGYSEIDISDIASRIVVPQLSTILKDTYGVILYQEQVMQIARELAGARAAAAAVQLRRRALARHLRARVAARPGARVDRARALALDLELARVDLTTLPSSQYGGGDMSRVRTLRDFITTISASIGHFNGEGHCQERVQ